jgi:hypothetical protein
MVSFQYKIDGACGRGAQFDEPQDLHDSPLGILRNMSNFPCRPHDNLRIAERKSIISIKSPLSTEGKRTIEGWSSHVFSTKNLKCAADIDSSFLTNVRRQRTATMV